MISGGEVSWRINFIVSWSKLLQVTGARIYQCTAIYVIQSYTCYVIPVIKPLNLYTALDARAFVQVVV